MYGGHARVQGTADIYPTAVYLLTVVEEILVCFSVGYFSGFFKLDAVSFKISIAVDGSDAGEEIAMFAGNFVNLLISTFLNPIDNSVTTLLLIGLYSRALRITLGCT